MVYIYPPVGLMILCEKPAVTATTPKELVIDTLKLKSALQTCSQYVADYLKWEREHGKN
ncbi:Rz1-like lysis system protein LysC [Photobacterium damselae]